MLINNPLYMSDIQKILSAKSSWDTLKNSSFLIVGASGMIGSFLIDTLMTLNKKEGANIRIGAMGRSISKLKQRFLAYQEDELFTMLEGDITKGVPTSERFDYVFHAASNTHPEAYATDPIGTVMTNILGTQQVLDYAVKHQVTRTIFLSTVEVYGEALDNTTSFSETDFGYIDCNTLRAGYSEGKRASEALCQAYIEQKKIDVVIPRVCRVFGPTMLLNDSKASSQFIMKAARGEDIVLKSKGEQLFSYAYVADVVDALLFLLLNGQNGQAYNIASPEFNLQLKELAQSLATLANTKVIFDLPTETEAKGFSKVNRALLDTNKIRNLGWQPIFKLEETLSHTVAIVRENVL
ncbi:NAD-dependent epimerase/dehydratase family protein [Vagococcus sp. BWB3-3]|uniref:NAD-dependent epimerase/dehydratase family protein n=1 Tax=Vagococcus allomyrinae TaxID=2794353 RepID=A0A940STY1_9ENTE|nr:NAD-dependent epimerase/dehydratase family protein [Vagococcus allomyrinae]MBP1043662.1 NAD-dependent epimerase/dehydratase family protein [Vagococcus allomyrinae]